jgi:hypothetical protein
MIHTDEVELNKRLRKATWKLFWSAVDATCLVFGLGFVAYAGFMTPDYAGENHNLQIIGMLLMVLGTRQR